jgi:hypothetical protein
MPPHTRPSIRATAGPTTARVAITPADVNLFLTAAGANRAHLARDIPEPHVLEELVDEAFNALHRRLLVDSEASLARASRTLTAARAISASHDDPTVDDASGIPQRQFGAAHLAGPPVFTYGALTDIQLVELRALAHSLARFTGVLSADEACLFGSRVLGAACPPGIHSSSSSTLLPAVPAPAPPAPLETHLQSSVRVLSHTLDEVMARRTKRETDRDTDTPTSPNKSQRFGPIGPRTKEDGE